MNLFLKYETVKLSIGYRYLISICNEKHVFTVLAETKGKTKLLYYVW